MFGIAHIEGQLLHNPNKMKTKNYEHVNSETNETRILDNKIC